MQNSPSLPGACLTGSGMADLTLNAARIAVAEMCRDKALSIKPTEVILWGPWTDEEVTQARKLAEEASNETP